MSGRYIISRRRPSRRFILLQKDSPILVIDSGLGGLAVATALRQRLPNEDIVFFGDTARLPYGNKSPAAITSFVRQIIQHFETLAPKHIVLACNTATAVALPHLRLEFPDLSISGVIAPAARATAIAAGNRAEPRIGVIATEATVQSRAYEKSIIRRRHMARVFQLATPLLVPIVEEGRGGDDPLVQMALEQYLAPLKERLIDVLVLGCTHYTLLSAALAVAAGRGIDLIDSSRTCVDDIVRRLNADDGLREARVQRGLLRCCVSDNPVRFSTMAARLIGFDAPVAELMTLNALPATPWALRQAG